MGTLELGKTDFRSNRKDKEEASNISKKKCNRVNSDITQSYRSIYKEQGEKYAIEHTFDKYGPKQTQN